MQITGEKGELLVCGQGQGHLIVFGKARRNQLSIEKWAHAEPITQIVSLSKLRNKYFATRCGDGHVNIYSSLSQPDRIAQLFNFDGDPDELYHLQPQPDVEEKPVVVEKKPREDGEEDDEEDAPADEPAPEEDEPKKKKKLEPQPPVAPLLVGRPEPSVRDTMIELHTKALLQTSSTILAVSCFKNKQVLIVNVDIKTRSKTIRHKIANKQSPTYLYQIDEDHLLVGTLGGKFELWFIGVDGNNEPPSLKMVMDAHPGSQEGVSQIVRLVDPSPMITGDKVGDKCQFLVSTAADQPEILIWRLQVSSAGNGQAASSQTVNMKVHIQIKTSFVEGLKFIVQTSPTQLVGVNHDKKLMFYDFVDKSAQVEKEEMERMTTEFSALVEEAFREADSDGNGWLDLDECKPMCESLIKSFGESLSETQKEVLAQKMFNWLDTDNSGKVTFFEFKVALMRAYIKRSLPEELLLD